MCPRGWIGTWRLLSAPARLGVIVRESPPAWSSGRFSALPRRRTSRNRGLELQVSLDEPGQLLPKALEHPAPGEENGVEGQPKLLGDLRRRLAFQDVAVERLPGGRGKIA